MTLYYFLCIKPKVGTKDRVSRIFETLESSAFTEKHTTTLLTTDLRGHVEVLPPTNGQLVGTLMSQP